MLPLRVLLILYRQLCPLTIAVSLLMWLAAGYPTPKSDQFMPFITRFFWLRSLSQLVIWYLYRLTNRKGFVFYHHFGLSELQLASGVYLIDILLFSLCVCLASLFIQ